MNKWLLRILIICEVGGGFCGLIIMFGSTLKEQELTPNLVITSIVISIVFLFGIIAGLILIEKPYIGLTLSATYQFIQIPVLISTWLSYSFGSGAMLSVYVHEMDIRYYFLFGTHINIRFHNFDAPLGFGVNIVAIILFILIIIQINILNKSKPTSSLKESDIACPENPTLTIKENTDMKSESQSAPQTTPKCGDLSDSG